MKNTELQEEHDKLKKAQRIVIKFGTNVLTSEHGGLAFSRIYSFIEDIARLKDMGKDVIIVSSGSIGLGMQKLGIEKTPALLSLNQACAAIGQSKLMSLYEEGFGRFNHITAQVLLTEEDFSMRKKHLSLTDTLHRLLEFNVIPIINENDTVAINDIYEEACDKSNVCFSDNDKLAALVTCALQADLMIIVSDVKGLYNSDPRQNPQAELIHLIPEVTEEIEALGFKASTKGRGGMKTKLDAAKIVTQSGKKALIVNGRQSSILHNIFEGEFEGSLFLAAQQQ